MKQGTLCLGFFVLQVVQLWVTKVVTGLVVLDVGADLPSTSGAGGAEFPALP